MKSFLLHERVKLKALSPIFIGDGEKIGKKEYIYLPKEQKVCIPKPEKLYTYLAKRNLAGRFEEFMLDNNRLGLADWLKNTGVPVSAYGSFMDYELPTAKGVFDEARSGGKAVRPQEILTFIKDPYGNPYIPGSSIKGMLRTALIAETVRKNHIRFDGIRRKVDDTIRNTQNAKRNSFLNRECMELEKMIFHTLSQDEKRAGDAVNCNLKGLIVSDSKPLSVKNLTLSQKIDYNLKKEEKKLPILRECLAPGTEVSFDLSIDREICPYGKDEIQAALDGFNELCYQAFYRNFLTLPQQKGVVWIGGGCGFLSKTVVYALFQKRAVEVTDEIFKATLGKQYLMHKHNRDVSMYRLAPHVCKCTRYNNMLYPMGRGQMIFDA